jgi:hypothetical protein
VRRVAWWLLPASCPPMGPCARDVPLDVPRDVVSIG